MQRKSIVQFSFTTLFLLISTTTMAQSYFSFFNNTNPTPAQSNNATPSPSGSPTNQVMSPDDFQNTVNQLGQQNWNNLSQQAKQQMSQLPKPPPLPPSIPPSTGNTTPPNLNNQAVTTPPPANTNANPVVTAPPASVGYQAGTNAAPLPPPANPQTIVKPPQNQVYTGFTFGNQNQNTGTSTTNSATPNNSTSGGWNIKY